MGQFGAQTHTMMSPPLAPLGAMRARNALRRNFTLIDYDG
jgi:hypothetical protein